MKLEEKVRKDYCMIRIPIPPCGHERLSPPHLSGTMVHRERSEVIFSGLGSRGWVCFARGQFSLVSFRCKTAELFAFSHPWHSTDYYLPWQQTEN